MCREFFKATNAGTWKVDIVENENLEKYLEKSIPKLIYIDCLALLYMLLDFVHEYSSVMAVFNQVVKVCGRSFQNWFSLNYVLLSYSTKAAIVIYIFQATSHQKQKQDELLRIIKYLQLPIK